MPQQSNDYRIAVFGCEGVGKSSLVHRFVKGTFRDCHVPTVEDTYSKVINNNKQVCTLIITDTAGSNQFPAMQRLAIQKGHAFVLVYSVTSRCTLDELKPVVDEIKELKGGLDMVPVLLVGNKADSVPGSSGVEGSGGAKREVTMSEGTRQAKHWQCHFIETSAKIGTNVEEVFDQLLHLEKRRVVPTQSKRSLKKKRQLSTSNRKKCAIM